MPALLEPGRSFSGLIQAAGVLDLEEAAMLAQSGVHCLGFPLRLDVHTQDQSEEEAAYIIASLPPEVQPVCITYETSPREVVALCRALGVHCVQLHADLPSEEGAALLKEVKKLAPNLFLIKSLIVRSDPQGLAEAASLWQEHADAFITDTYDPHTGASGATGKTHDWDVSRSLAGRINRPLILAGGLGPDNVARAIRYVRPAGVDAHTGLEDALGRKDPALVRAFVSEARRAFADL